MTSAKPPLFFQRRFFPLWTALALGAFTDNMLKQALSIALVYGVITAPLISNDDALPIVGSLFPIAMVLFSTLSGQIADKYETLFMFKRTKFAEFLLMVLAAVGFFIHSAPILILTLFLMGAQSAFFSPVRTAAMPKYLAPAELVRGNALCGGGLFVSVMVGIVIGGMLITKEGGPVQVSLILVIAALIGWLVIRQAPEAAANDPTLTIDWNLPAQATKLIEYTRDAPGVMRPVLAVAWYWSVGALVTVCVPLFVRDTLYGDETVTTAMMAIFAVGAAIGAIIASLLAKGRSGLGLSTAGISGAGLLAIAIFVLSQTIAPPVGGTLIDANVFFATHRGQAMAVAFLLSSISTAIFVVPMQAAVQRRAPSERRARILAANNMLNALGATIGAWSVLLITRFSITPEVAFVIIGIAQLGIATYMLRRKKTQPEGRYDESLMEAVP